MNNCKMFERSRKNHDPDDYSIGSTLIQGQPSPVQRYPMKGSMPKEE
jgi:hypothetical protein